MKEMRVLGVLAIVLLAGCGDGDQGSSFADAAAPPEDAGAPSRDAGVPPCICLVDGGDARDAADAAADARPPEFVHPSGGDFVFPDGANGFVGMNVRGLPHYGTSLLPYASSAQIAEQLDGAKAAGARVVRVFAAGHDADAATVAARLGTVLDAAKARGLYVIAALTDFYATGFSPQGDDGAYVAMGGYTILGDAWFSGGFRTHYLPWVDAVVTRWAAHPALFAWEVGNEVKDNANPSAYVSYVAETAARIRAHDAGHMITTGAISTVNASLRGAGDLSHSTLAWQLYANADVSFLVTHDYHGAMAPDDDTDLAKALGKPIVVEEEGYSSSDGDRASLVLANGRAWRGEGARGFMQWGFLVVAQDNGDGDRDTGMDKIFHADFDGLAATYVTLASEYR